MKVRVTLFMCVGTALGLFGCAPTGTIEAQREALGQTAFRGQADFSLSDDDKDKVLNAKPDNCVNTPNPSQDDADRDGFGDACDPNPQQQNSPGIPAARGEPAIQSIEERIESQQGVEVEGRVYATMVRVCRMFNIGAQAKDAKNLKAALTDQEMQFNLIGGLLLGGAANTSSGTPLKVYAVTPVSLNKRYLQIEFALGSKFEEFKTLVGGAASLDQQGARVRYWDDTNDNNAIDPGEQIYGPAHWLQLNKKNAGVLVASAADPGFFSTLIPSSGGSNSVSTGSASEGIESQGTCDEVISSPLLLNLDHKGFAKFSSAEVKFDLDGDGVLDLVGWPTGKADAFLALDRNGDGVINGGAELFGNHTPLKRGLAADNGFEALKEFDQDQNGRIDEHDPVFAKLLLWLDGNGDGLSQQDELFPLSAYGIRWIGVEYMSAEEVDENGNQTRQRAIYAYQPKDRGEEKLDIVIDVWFNMKYGV